jgi:hypothetical protein
MYTFCTFLLQDHPDQWNDLGFLGYWTPGVQAVFRSCKITKFDCITGEILTFRDKIAIFPEQEVLSTFHRLFSKATTNESHISLKYYFIICCG